MAPTPALPPRDCPKCERPETLWYTYRLFEAEKGPEVGCGRCGYVVNLAARVPAVSFVVDLDGKMVDKTPTEPVNLKKR